MWTTIVTITAALAIVQCFIIREDSRRSSTFQTTDNYKLNGYSFHKQRSTCILECARACLSENRCWSFNFHHSGIHINCHLNSKNASAVEQWNFVFFEEYTYGELIMPVHPKTCSELKNKIPITPSGKYTIDPDGQSGVSAFTVYCDMTDKGGLGVTVVSHDSEARTLVDGYGGIGTYSRDVSYSGASMAQLAKLTEVSSNCEQFIQLECKNDVIFLDAGGYGWWVSRDGVRQNYWGGAAPGSWKCACGINKNYHISLQTRLTTTGL